MNLSPPHFLKVVYQDSCLVAVDKPAGMLVHRSKIDPNATQFAMTILRDQLKQKVFPVHRLDRPTSGILLFALNSQTARKLCSQFENQEIQKTYLAIVRGHPTGRVWDEPLKEKLDRITDKKANRLKSAKPAITRFRTMRNWTLPYSTGKYPQSRYSLVEISPLTGRKHQIRRHFNHMGYPIVGDSTYGDRRHNRLFRQQLEIRNLLLTAQKIELNHPYENHRMTIEIKTSDCFLDAIQKLDRLDLLGRQNSVDQRL